MDLQMIAAPVIGGIIGLITNGLAIKMLFLPTQRDLYWKVQASVYAGIDSKGKKSNCSSNR